MSFFSALGGDVKKAFGWLGSPKGKAVVQIGEAVVEDIFPAATGVINLINTWATEAIKVESIAEAAGATSGSGEQKATIVLNTLTPQVLAFAKEHGLPLPTPENVSKVNDAVISILNLLTGKITPPGA